MSVLPDWLAALPSPAARLMLFARLLEAWEQSQHPRDGRGRFRKVGASDLLNGTVDVTKLSDRKLGDLFSELDDTSTAEQVFYVLGGEMDRRDAAARYRAVVDSIPDAEGLKTLTDDKVMNLFAQVTAVSRDPDPGAFARLGNELDRRLEVERAERERPAREFLARPVESMSDDDLDQASQFASEIGDTAAMERVFGEWERRENAEKQRIEAERKAAAQAEADKLAAEQSAARAEAERVARDNAEREQLAAEFRAMSQSQVATEFVSNASSLDPDKRKRHDAALVELARRDQLRKEEESRQKAAARRERMFRGPVEKLSDDELRDAIADIDADGLNSNSVRQRRLVELRGEQSVRKAEQDRIAALAAAVPTVPARVRNPIGAVGELEMWSAHYSGMPDRLERARMAALGIAEPELSPNLGPGMAYQARKKAVKKAIAEAEKTDPRSVQEQSAMILAHYRHQLEVDGVKSGGTWSKYERGPDEDPQAPPPRPAAVAEHVPKADQVWLDMHRQANADKGAGDPSGLERIRLATVRALGLPDDATDGEIRDAYRYDRRSSGRRDSQRIAEFRKLAEEAGVDPSDRLRFGPPLRGADKAKARPSHHRESTPAQSARIDQLVAAGRDYLDAYAEVHDLDADQLHREQAGQAAAGGGTGGGVAAIRKAYDEHVSLQYLDAELATTGHLLSKAGRAKNIRPESLFSGPMSVARKYASEELLRYWSTHPRMTFAEFQAQMTGKANQARKRRLAAAAGKDFV